MSRLQRRRVRVLGGERDPDFREPGRLNIPQSPRLAPGGFY
jgi:hypothetical protein